MPRYIKDGAYTIVIEDTKPAKRPKSQDGTTTTTGDSNQQTEDGQDSQEAEQYENDEEEEEEEVINFASPEFMLQNLDIAKIDYQSDKTCMLKARTEIAELMAIQACYYTYIALQPYVHRPEPPIILLMGDGFIGSKVANKLAEHGCKPYLKIFSRGEFGSKEWRKQGFTSSSSLPHLLKKTKPSVLLMCTDNTSIYMIFHQLREMDLLSPDMMAIVCTLGAQRKKVYYNFTTPSVFRCYVEPQVTLRRMKMELVSALATSKDAGELRPRTPPDVDASGLNTMMDSVLGALNEEGEEFIKSATQESAAAAEDSQDESSVEEDIPTTPIEKAARLVIERTPEVVKFINLVENYYCMNNISVEEARKMALRTVVGYVENTSRPKSSEATTPVEVSSRPGSRGRRRVGSSRRKPAITVKAIEKLLLSLYMDIGRAFHREFSKLITMRELIALAEQSFEVLDDERAEAENKKEMYIDTQGKHHIIKLQRGTKAIYERSYIHAIFAIDDEVFDNPGPSFDFIRNLDAAEESK